MELKQRLRNLSPEKRALLASRLSKQRVEAAVSSVGDTILHDRDGLYKPFPLTDLQQAYWMGRSGAFQIGDVATHCYLEIENVGLDLGRLNIAFQRLIDGHDVLRAIVLPDGRQQFLKDVPPYRIEVSDLRGEDSSASATEVERIRERMSHQVRPADQWPLFEVRAALLDQSRVRIFVSLDGLILDAWSISLLFKEWVRLYDAPETEVDITYVSFRDYVLAEASLNDSEDYQRSQKYWQARVETLPPAPQLPVDKDPSLLENTRFVRSRRHLPPECWLRLKTRAAQAGLTPTGLLLAAYSEVLTLWSASPKFTLSVPRFNRLPLHPQVNRMLGEFASFTLLEVDNSADESFEVRARRLQKRMWEDLDHSHFSGVEVLRELAARNAGKAPPVIMPVVFTASARDEQGADAYPTSAAEGLGQVVYAINQSSQVFLDNHVSEQAGTLVCDWDTVEGVLPNGLSREMLDAYFRLLTRLGDDESCWLETRSQLASTLMSSAETEVRANTNTLTPVPDELLQSFFERQATTGPQQTAVVSNSRTLSYDELLKLSRRWGRRLREFGAMPNTPVAIVMEKGWEQVVAVLAVLQSGAAYLPLDPAVPTERLRHMLVDSEAKLLLTQSWLNTSLGWPDQLQRFCVDTEDPGDNDSGRLESAQQPDDLAYIIYTSGSTGPPKGVTITHRAVVNSIIQTNLHFQIGSKDRVLALTALHHDMSVYDIFGTLAVGGTLVIPPAIGARDPACWSQVMCDEQVTVWNSVPAMMEMLLEYADDRPGTIPRSLRVAFLGGDWIPVALPGRLKGHVASVRVVSVGGPTETTLWNIWYAVDEVDSDWKSIPYGKPIANTRYYLLNDVLADCPTWVPGEMYCAGVGLSPGYWRDPEKTRAKFIVHPRTGERLYRTGDIGCFMPDGNIRFLGRADLQVKMQGQRIEIGEIEAALCQHPDVRAAAVKAVGDHIKKRLIGYVVSSGEAGSQLQGLSDFLRERLPDHMIPSNFVTLETLPHTRNGKVDRAALPDPPEPGLEADTSRRANRNGVGSQIEAIVAKVLGMDRINPAVSLLSYGANSIDMVRIGNQLEKQFGFRPRMDHLFRLQTVDALENYLEDHLTPSQGEAEIVEQEIKSGVKALLASYTVMLDPAEREAFKKRQPGIRTTDDSERYIQLTSPLIDDKLKRQYDLRRSYRRFSLKMIPNEKFGKFLSCLYQIRIDGAPKYLYASPGGLYPTQTYLHVKPGRVEGVGAGTWYYHPVEHRLVSLTPNVDLDRSIHIPFINTPVFDEAAFSIFLVTQLSAIAPAYGDRSIHFATLEAGVIAHLMEMSAPEYGLGMCQIGHIDFERIRHLFLLEESHILIHSLVGGSIDRGAPSGDALGQRGGTGRVAELLSRIKRLSETEVKSLLEANKLVERGGDKES